MRKQFRCAVAAILVAACLCAAGGILLCETAVHVRRLGALPSPAFAVPRDVSIVARDGVLLRAWRFAPERGNGNCVITLHGVGDDRRGTLGLAQLFLENGYVVFLPDARAHGESGGAIATYGLLERDDVHRWVDWLFASEHPRNVFGMGESMGAGILLQSLAVEKRFSAVVAESPFANFEKIAEYRVAQRLPVGGSVAMAVAKPLVWSGFLYARSRYGIDLRAADPAGVVASASTPILLIHGLRDTNIPPEQSRALMARNPRHITLWLVPGATHTGAFAAAPEQFRSRVLQWFSDHAQ